MKKAFLLIFKLLMIFSLSAMAKPKLNVELKLGRETVNPPEFHYPSYELLNGEVGYATINFWVNSEGIAEDVDTEEYFLHQSLTKQIEELFYEGNLLNYKEKFGTLKVSYETTDNPSVQKIIDEHSDLYEDSNYSKAKTELLKAKELEPKNPALNYLLAKVYWKLGEQKKAIKKLTEMLVIYPNNADLHYALAYRLYATDQYKAALKHAKQSQNLNETWEVYWLLSELSLKSEDKNQSLKYLNKALKITNDRGYILRERGWLLRSMESYHLALKDFKEALVIEKNDSNALSGITRVLVDLEKPEEAKLFNERALAINPDDTYDLFMAGTIYDELKSYNLAISYYKKLLAIDPAYESAHNNLGYSYTKAGNYKKAIQTFKLGLENNHETGMLLNNLGVAYYFNNQCEYALEQFDIVLGNYSSKSDLNGFTKSYIARCKIIQGELDSALKLIDEIVNNEPDYYDAYYEDVIGHGNFLMLIIKELRKQLKSDDFEKKEVLKKYLEQLKND